MRKLMLSAATLLVAGFAMTGAPRPAAAQDYAWCVVGAGEGYPGDCSYTSYGQCQASASGRRAWCNVNPRVAFGATRQGRGGYPGYQSW